MSDNGFEKGLKLLLNNAYNKPHPSEEFRAELLQKLRTKQRSRHAARKHKVIALYSSLTAAAAVFVLSVVPVIDPAVEIKDNSPAPTASNLTELEANWRPGRNFATTASYPAPNTTPSYVDINAPRTVTIENAPQEKDTLKPLMNISADSVRAINQLEYKTASENEWQHAAAGSEIHLKSGMEIRTPLGAVDPVSFAIKNGPLVMLDGSSSVEVNDGGLRLNDGRAVISLTGTDNALKVLMQGHDLSLQPGSTAFLRMEQGADFAENGSPVPVMVLLKGEAATLDKFDTRLYAGRVYELYETGTGKFPSRQIGSYESQRRFMPMINAIQAANVGY